MLLVAQNNGLKRIMLPYTGVEVKHRNIHDREKQRNQLQSIAIPRIAWRPFIQKNTRTATVETVGEVRNQTGADRILRYYWVIGDFSKRPHIFHSGNVGQVSIEFPIVQTIADHEFIWNTETYVVSFDDSLPSLWFIKQGAYFQ